MEVVALFVGAVVQEVSEVLFRPIYDRIKNIYRFQTNVDALEEEMENLVSRRDDVKRELEAADKEGKLPTFQVEKWLKDVNKIEGEMNSVPTSKADSSRTISWFVLNCCLRCKLSNKVVHLLDEVTQLLKDGNFPEGVAAVSHLPVPVEHIPGPSIEGQSTASRTLAMIRELLNDDKVGRIGVWGMGGVGKTTLVKNLNNMLKRTLSMQPFSIILWATVSKDFDLKRVQMQLAQRLKLAYTDESPERMAACLNERLEKENKFLLILDDVWDAIDLDELGVPRPEVHKGSKIILTSRSTEVCSQMMTDANIRVDVLNDEESWELFCENAGEGASLKPIKPFAEAVAKECCGLPLAIITVGKSLRGKAKLEVWEDALFALQRSVPLIKGIENKVYKPLKYSYDSLQDERIKSCFLCCCLYPEDYAIEVSALVRLWCAEGLLDEHLNYEQQENRGVAIVESLMDSCLLEPCAQGDIVKMHDVVRDVAIWIASSTENGSKSFIQSGIHLRQFPNNELVESNRKLSFVNNELTSLPDHMQCPEASTLLLRGSRFLEKVPHGFLQGFPVLRMLDLSGSCIRSLPRSLLQLSELRALLLSGCRDLKQLPPLEGLSRLQVLDCCSTRIKALPEGMENLTSLRQLDLSYTCDLETIPAGTLTKLSNLEFLDMRRSRYRWVRREIAQMGQAPFEELLHLERLIVLYIDLWSIPNSSSMDYISWIKRLTKFGIFIKDNSPTTATTQNFERMFIRPRSFVRRHVSLKNYNLSAVVHSWWLLVNATSVDIYGCSYIDLMLGNLALMSRTIGAFTGLKSLTIGKSKYGFQPGVGRSFAESDLLPNLEHLHLYSLDFLETISDLAGYLGLQFPKLCLLEVIECPKLKYLLPIGGSILILEELEKIKVVSCEKLEELFCYASSSQTITSDPVFPKLRLLELKDLPRVKTLCEDNESWPRFEQLGVLDCNLIRKLPLTVQNGSNLKEIRGQPQWWSQLEWDDEDTKFRLECYFTPILPP